MPHLHAPKPIARPTHQKPRHAALYTGLSRLRIKTASAAVPSATSTAAKNFRKDIRSLFAFPRAQLTNAGCEADRSRDSHVIKAGSRAEGCVVC